MNWYKKANIIGRDPFSVDFAHEREKAKQMDTDTLLHALSDAIEASQVSVNEGKYYDQASVYRQELENRGISFVKQDEMLKKIPSLHTNSQEVENLKKADVNQNSPLKPGDYAMISGGSGIDSDKMVIIVPPSEIETDGRGVPTNVQGAYKPVDWSKELAFKYLSSDMEGNDIYGTMFKNRLRHITKDEYDAEFGEYYPINDPMSGQYGQEIGGTPEGW